MTVKKSVATDALLGHMTDCPGYLGIVLEDKVESLEFARYDLLVSCPPLFNVTFLIPNSGGDVERTFGLALDDSHQVHRVYLTRIAFRWYATERCDEEAKARRFAAEYPEARHATVILLLFVAFAGVLCCSYRCVASRIATRGKPTSPRLLKLVPKTLENHVTPATTRSRAWVTRLQRLNRCQRTMMVVYVAVQLLQGVLFTTTCVSTVLRAYVGDYSPVTALEGVNVRLLRELDGAVRAVDGQVSQQLDRRFQSAARMEVACGEYFDDLAETLLSKKKEEEEQKSGVPRSVSSAVGKLYSETIGRYRERVRRFQRDHRRNFDAQVRANLAPYGRLVRRFIYSPWLMFAQSVFNQSSSAAMFSFSRRTRRKEENEELFFFLSKNETAFVAFLGLCYFEFLDLWELQYWEKYSQRNSFSSKFVKYYIVFIA